MTERFCYTTDQHPINPPLEVVQYWVDALLPKGALNAFTVAAQWGYQQAVKELENYLEQLND
jgi:hypothetical protein